MSARSAVARLRNVFLNSSLRSWIWMPDCKMLSVEQTPVLSSMRPRIMRPPSRTPRTASSKVKDNKDETLLDSSVGK